MRLNLFDILQNVLNEAVSSEDVNDAINNKFQVIINYRDDKSRAIEKRLIEPYVYGLSKAGNEVFRAYQYEGDTFRGKPKWKLFRLDRVESWNPTNQHFNQQPNERGWNAEHYNENDGSMPTVLNSVKFDDEVDDGIFRTDFEKQMLKRKQVRQQSNAVTINQLKNNSTTQPSKPTNVPQDTNNQEKQIEKPKNVQDIENTQTLNGPTQTDALFKQLSDDQWMRDSMSPEEKRNKNILKRRDKRAFDRADNSRMWRKGAENEKFLNNNG